jgi:hypothetical protein
MARRAGRLKELIQKVVPPEAPSTTFVSDQAYRMGYVSTYN